MKNYTIEELKKMNIEELEKIKKEKSEEFKRTQLLKEIAELEELENNKWDIKKLEKVSDDYVWVENITNGVVSFIDSNEKLITLQKNEKYKVTIADILKMNRSSKKFLKSWLRCDDYRVISAFDLDKLNIFLDICKDDNKLINMSKKDFEMYKNELDKAIIDNALLRIIQLLKENYIDSNKKITTIYNNFFKEKMNKKEFNFKCNTNIK